MDIQKIIDELRAEQEQIDEAILSLSRLASGQGKRRGRPPKWMTDAAALTEKPKRRGRPPGSGKKKSAEPAQE